MRRPSMRPEVTRPRRIGRIGRIRRIRREREREGRPVRCERVQLAWSERMDGGHPPVAVAEALDTHLETCPQCRAYADGAQRVRELARFTLLEPVPDLIAPIMQRVALEAAPGRARPARSRLRSVGAAEPIPPETVRPETARTDTARTETRK